MRPDDKLRDLQMDEARAEGSLLSIVSTLLIYHEHGGEKPEHWARLRNAYDTYQARHSAVIDCIFEPFEEFMRGAVEGTIYAQAEDET